MNHLNPDGYRLVRGDSVEHLVLLEDVDAIVTDPPYCSGAVSEARRTSSPGQGMRTETLKKFGWFTGDNMGTAGLVFLMRAMAFRALECLKPTGHLIVFCDWRMVPNLAPAIESSGMRYQNMIVWDKRQMGLGAGFRAQHEIALHFTVGDPEYHDQGTSNVISSDRVPRGEREHQTQKPVDMMAKIIRVVTPPGGLVVDPFMGSGSTGIAALSLGRKFVGIERDWKTLELAKERIERSLAQNELPL